MDWHSLSVEEVLKKLKTSKEGLSLVEIEKRLEKFGKNKLPEEKPISSVRIFFEQFQSPLIYILLIAGIVTLIFGKYIDSIVIFGAVILNTIVGFVQENKASEALRELKKVVKIETQVIREGNPKIVDSQDLVPGDIFTLAAGDKVPADGRIIESFNLKTNEMALTGEWLSAKKITEILPKERPLADRDNMVYMGTIVEYGKGKAVVTETGLKTEMGKVAMMIKETKEEKTPYQKKLAHFSKIVGIIIAIICFAIFIEGIITGYKIEGRITIERFVEMFETSVAVAVAAIPEGLPVAMTVILALGMQRILKRKGLVRKLLATETLGSTSVICTDKTATLTEGKMRVSEVLTLRQILGTGQVGMKDASYLLALKIATILSEAFIENPEEVREKWIVRGDPTSRALLLAGIEAGINKKELEKKMPKIDEAPFDPIHKYIAGLYQLDGENFVLYVCGAPEKILDFSTYLEGEEKLTPEKLKKLEKKLENLTEKGLRVVAVAYKNYKKGTLKYEKLEELCNDLVFVGFLALKDPLRKEVKEAIKVCRQAGMRPILVTGDHKLTARAVAQEIGLKINEKNILEGKDLDKLSDRDFEKILPKIQTYARVEPKHKMRIISAWQKRGEVVAMTGDGINDAPALKKADIGVALGSGTDVAKEVSDLILLPDSFNIIVAAVEEGRAILDNIRKVITYLLSDSFCEVILIGGSMIISWLTHQTWILPVTAAQILWTNLVEDGLPGVALAFEPKEKDLMKRKAGGHEIPLLTEEMKALILIAGLVDDILLLGLFFWLLKFSGYPIPHIRSIMFANLATDTLYFSFCCKSLRRNLWHINPFSNKFLNIALIVSAILLFGAIYFPPLQMLLKTEPLYLFDWGLVSMLTLIDIIFIEATKWHFITKKQLTTNN